MVYAYVPAYYNIGAARGPRLAVVWHMAEGGGTVGYLSRQNPNGVSVHYVIEYRGRIVQMLNESRMHTSIRIKHPSGAHAIRHTNDADGFYGQAAAVAVMGKWADVHTSLGPNHASIGVEIEGFAADGPNAKQRPAMAALFADLRTRYPFIRSLGHRDFNLKACPGRKIPWDAVGGHGTTPATPETTMPGLDTYLKPDGPLLAGIAHIPAGTEVINLETRDRFNFQGDGVRHAVGPAIRRYKEVEGWYVDYQGGTCWVDKANVSFTPNVTGPVADYYEVIVGGKKVGSVSLP